MSSSDTPLWQQWRNKPSAAVRKLWEDPLELDPEKIAAHFEVDLQLVRGVGWAGACRGSHDGHATVWLNADKPLLEQRFTLLHEISHLLLHPLEKPFRDITTGLLMWPEVEKEANYYAAALLIPRDQLIPLVNETNLTLGAMASLFKVTVRIVALRLDMLRSGQEP